MKIEEDGYGFISKNDEVNKALSKPTHYNKITASVHFFCVEKIKLLPFKRKVQSSIEACTFQIIRKAKRIDDCIFSHKNGMKRGIEKVSAFSVIHMDIFY